MTISGDHSINGQNVNVNIENLVIVTSGPEGDVARAGSALESELIRKTLLENGDLRRMVRTVENAPGAIFNLTKGKKGPAVLRNVRKDGTKVAELRDTGVEHCTTIAYCKATAVAMVDELRRVVGAVDASAPDAVRQWAEDVDASLKRDLASGVDYVAALRLYCDASSKFYKLPSDVRQAIAGGVRSIGDFIAEHATF